MELNNTSLSPLSLESKNHLKSIALNHVPRTKKHLINLYSAALNGDLDTVKYFVETQAQNIHSKNDLGQTPLYCAAVNGHLDIVHYLIQQGADLQTEDKFNLDFLDKLALNKHFLVVEYLFKEKNKPWLSLEEAAEKGYLGLVRYFIEKKDQFIDTQNSTGWTPLHIAALKNHLTIVEYLVQKGADINMVNHAGYNALQIAVFNGHLSIVKYLLGKLSPFPSHKILDRTLLQGAASNGHLAVLRYLLSQNELLSLENVFDYNILNRIALNRHFSIIEYLNQEKNISLLSPREAAEKGYLGLAQYLFEKRNVQHINGKDHEGQTSLHKAAANGHLDLVRYLISQKADLNSVDEQGKTPLNLAIQKNHLNVVQYLIEEEKINVNVLDTFGSTPLDSAAMNGYLDMVQYLVRQGAELSTENKTNREFSHSLIFNHHFSVIQYLVNQDKMTLPNVWEAAKKGYLDIVRYFITTQAESVRATDDLGQTPLHQAASYGRLAVVEYLVHKGAKLDHKDKLGNTPLYQAASNGHLMTLHFLIERLIKQGAELAVKQSIFTDLLITAAFHGHLAMVKYLIRKIEKDSPLESDVAYLPLYNAIVNGHLNIVQYLVEEKKIDVHSTIPDWAFLEQAALNGHLRIVKYLLSQGAKLQAKNKFDLGFLNAIALHGHFQVIEYLSKEKHVLLPSLGFAAEKGYLGLVHYCVEEKNQLIDAQDINGRTPLHKAVISAHLDIVQYLVAQGADWRAMDKQSKTPLDEAIENNYLEIVQYLIEEKRIDLNASYSIGQSLLERAALSGHLRIVKYLLTQDADLLLNNKFDFDFLNTLALKDHFSLIEYLNHEKNIPLPTPEVAAEKGYLGLVQYLVKVQSLYVQNSRASTLLHKAAIKGHLAVVQYLLSIGANSQAESKFDLNFLNKIALNSYFPVIEALAKEKNFPPLNLGEMAEKGYLGLVRYLVEKKHQPISIQDMNGRTPLHKATAHDHLDVMQYLIRQGANLNAIDEQGDTALDEAMKKGHLHIVRYLLEIGKIDVNIKNNLGLTLLDTATMNGHLAIVKYLLAKGADLVKYKFNSDFLNVLAFNNHLPLIEYLIKEKNISLPTLKVAAEKGYLGLVRYLVETQQAKPKDAEEASAWTPLYKAAMNGHLAIVKYLLSQEDRLQIEHRFDLDFLNAIALKNHFTLVDYLSKEKNILLPTLEVATEKDYLGLVRYLVEKKAQPVAGQDIDDQTPLRRAAMKGHLAMVNYLLSKTTHLQTAHEFDLDFLNALALKGRFQIIEYLSQEKNILLPTLKVAAEKDYLGLAHYLVEVQRHSKNVEDGDVSTPLYKAALNGHLAMVKYLLSQGAHLQDEDSFDLNFLNTLALKDHFVLVDYLSKEKNIPLPTLEIAAEKGYLGLVRYLIEMQSQHQGEHPGGIWIPLHSAAVNGHLAIVEYLLSITSDLSLENKFDFDFLDSLALKSHFPLIKYLNQEKKIPLPTLKIAAEKGYLGLVHYLIETQNQYRDALDHNVWSPLHRAAINGHLAIVKYLLSQEAHLQTEHEFDLDFFNILALKDHFQIVEYLSHEKNIPLPTLKVAVEKGYLGLVRYLAETQSQRRNAEESDAWVLLYIAAVNGHLAIVKYLLSQNSHLQIEPEINPSFLNIVSLHGHFTVVDYLSHEKNISLPTLEIAAEKGYLGFVRYLVEAQGQYKDAEKVGTWAPLYKAAMNGHLAIVKYLLPHGSPLPVTDKFNLDFLNTLALQDYFTLVEYLGKSIPLPTLEAAAEKGYLGLVRYLVETQSQYQEAHSDIWIALDRAIANDRLDIMQYLIEEKKIDVNAKNHSGWSLLDTAVLYDQLAIVKYLLSIGADFKLDNELGDKTLLDRAIEKGYLDIVQYLITEKKINVNARNLQGWSLLDTAAFTGQLAILKYLLSRCTCFSLNNSSDYKVLLAHAITKGHLDIMQYLITEKKIDVNSKDSRGLTLLDDTVLNNQLTMVKYLLSQGADFKQDNKSGDKTPLDHAVEKGYLSIAQYLIAEKKIDVNSKDSRGWTLLNRAMTSNQLDMMKYLLSQGADFKLNNNELGNSMALDYTIEKGYLNIVQHLITEKKIDINARDSFGMTLLDRMVMHDQLAMVKYLLSQGADFKLNVQSNYKTPLDQAIERGHLSIVQFLIEEKKINVNVRNLQGESFLDTAILNDQPPIVAYLLSIGADFKLDSEPGDRTALYHAIENGYLNVVQYLIEGDKVDVHTKDGFGWSLLDKAAYNGQLATMKYLIREGYHLEADDIIDLDFLNAVALNGYFSVVEYLVDELSVAKGISPLPTLWELAEKSHLGLVQYLVEYQYQSVDAQDSMGWTPLHSAAANGRLGIVQYLLNQGAHLNATNKAGDSPFDKAIQTDHLNVVKYLIEKQGLDVNIKNHLGQAPLHVAAANGRLSIVQYLLSQGAHLNTTDNTGNLPLDKAIQTGRLNVVKYFIDEQDLNVNGENYLGQTPLHVAAAHGRLNIIQYLLSQGAHLNATDSAGNLPLDKAIQSSRLNVIEYLTDNQSVLRGNNQTNDGLITLYEAAKRGRLDIIKYFFKNKSEQGITNTFLSSHLLHYAAYYGYLSLVEYLIGQNADLETKNNLGNTPLHTAVLGEQLEAVKYLIKKGAHLKAINNLGQTPFQIAASKEDPHMVQYFVEQQNEAVGNLMDAIRNNYLGIVKYLIESEKADLQTRDQHYKDNIIHHATIHAKLNLIQYLIHNGFDIFPKLDFTLTPLHTAVIYHRLEIVKYYLAQKAPLEAKEHLGNTPLYLAAGNYDLDILKCLVENGAQLNIKNNEGDTPLHHAILANDLDTLEYLVEKGAYLNTKNNRGNTPLHVAAKNDHLLLVQYLLNKGANLVAKNNRGTTPLQSAILAHHNNTAEYLKFKSIGITRGRRGIKFKEANTSLVTKNRDTMHSAASKPTYWINDLSNNLLSTFKSAPRLLLSSFDALSPDMNSGSSRENTVPHFKTTFVDEHATSLLWATIIGKMSKQPLFFKKNFCLASNETTNLRVWDAIENFPDNLASKKFNNDFVFSKPTKPNHH